MVKTTLDKHIGDRFGYLTIIGVKRVKVEKQNRSYFEVKCDCGNTKYVFCSNIKNGTIKSCGCKTKELMSKSLKKHGYSSSRVYKTYRGMKDRCYNENLSCYHRYGGRGVNICDEWLESFEAFKDWAYSNGYTDQLTIERINNDGNYEPNNCTWISLKEQLINRRIECGSDRYNSKLKESDVPEIRFLLSKGYTQKEIGNLYNVSKSTICSIKNNKTWRHVK